MGLFRNRDNAKTARTEPEPEPAEVAEPDEVSQPTEPIAVVVPAASERGTPTISGAEMQRLWTDGVPARATVKEIRDTGTRLAGNAVIDLDLAVTRDDDEPYETTLRLPIAPGDNSPFARGSEYNVRVDPQDQTRLVFAA